MKNIKGIVDRLIVFVKDNKDLLKRIYIEDQEVCDFRFDIDELINLLEKNKARQMKDAKKNKVLIYHYGNPYITAMLCMEAILQNCEITIGIEDICYGLNKAIIKMVNDMAKENRIKAQISLKLNPSKNDIEISNFDKIICLGNSNAYMNFRKLKNAKYIPLFDIALYYDSEEYEELAEKIRIYAIQNLYEIEIFDETEDFEDVIYSINHGLKKYCTVILSKDKEKQEKFEQEIQTKIVCVNQNPFYQFEPKIPDGIF